MLQEEGVRYMRKERVLKKKGENPIMLLEEGENVTGGKN